MLHAQLAATSIATATEAALAAVAGDSLVVDTGGNRRNPYLVGLKGISADCQYIRVRDPRNPTGIYQIGDVVASIKPNGGIDKIAPDPLINGETISVRGYQDSGGAQVTHGYLVYQFNGGNMPNQPMDVQSYRAAAPTACVANAWTRVAANVFATANFELINNAKYAIVRGIAYSATLGAARLECPEWDGMKPPIAANVDVGKPMLDFRDFRDLPTFTHPSPVHVECYDIGGTTNPVIILEVARIG